MPMKFHLSNLRTLYFSIWHNPERRIFKSSIPAIPEWSYQEHKIPKCQDLPSKAMENLRN